MDVERRTAVVNKRADAVFLRFAALVMMVVVMMVSVLMFFFVIIVIVMMMMLVLIVVIIVVMMMVVMLFFLFNLVARAFDFANPCRRRCHALKVEQTRVDKFVEVDLRIVTLNDFCARLQCSNHRFEAGKTLWSNHRSLVDKDDVAEFNLLDDKIFYIFFADILACQAVAAAKFVLHAERVNHSDDAVEAGDAVLAVFLAEARYGADGLRNWRWLAHTAGFNHDVVETLGLHQVVDLLHEVHLQSAADAAVLERHEAVVLRAHDAAFLDEVGVNVNLAYIVDNHGKLDAAFIGQNVVEQSSLAATKVAREQQNRDFFFCRHDNISPFSINFPIW